MGTRRPTRRWRVVGAAAVAALLLAAAPAIAGRWQLTFTDTGGPYAVETRQPPTPWPATPAGVPVTWAPGGTPGVVAAVAELGGTPGSYSVAIDNPGGRSNELPYSVPTDATPLWTPTAASTPTPVRTATRMPTDTATRTVAVPPPTGAVVSIWPAAATPKVAADSDAQAVELGVKFTSDVAGTVTGIRFYKSATNTGTHTASLWTSAGARLATATVAGETATGWQAVQFAQPVAIAANTVYVASYHTATGHYAGDNAYFSVGAYDAPPLHALANSTSPNGVYLYGAGGFPTQSYQASNYWVDVAFVPGTMPAATATASSTGTASTVPMDTASATATVTRTATPPATRTETVTATATSSATATFPDTPTDTATMTATATATAPPTPFWLWCSALKNADGTWSLACREQETP